MGRTSVRRSLGAITALLALLLLGVAWLSADPGEAAALPDPITDYATYPAGLVPAGCFAPYLTGVQVTVNGVTNASRTVSVPVAKDSAVHTTLTSGEATLVDDDFHRDCAEPAPTAQAELSCARGGVVVTVANTATVPVDYAVLKGDETDASGTVAANGGTAEVVVPLAEDETATMTVDAGGVTILGPQEFTLDCVQPGASIDHTCAAGGADVTLTNDGENPAEFTVEWLSELGAWQAEKVIVAGGGTQHVLVPIDEDATVTITVTVDGTQILQESVERNCVAPRASVTDDCAAGGIIVTLTNGGENDAAFTITANGEQVGDEVVVPGRGTVDVVVPMDEGETATVVVSSNGHVVDQATLTRHCIEGTVTFSASCAEGGATLTLVNAGQLPAVITLTKNGSVIDTITVDVAATLTRAYALEEDETATFRVTGPGFDSGDESVTLDCHEVAGTKFSRLPTTGSSTQLLVTLAGLLLLVGGLMVAIPARRRRLRY